MQGELADNDQAHRRADTKGRRRGLCHLGTGEHGQREPVGFEMLLAHLPVTLADAGIEARQVHLDGHVQRPEQVVRGEGDVAADALRLAVEGLQGRPRTENHLASRSDLPGFCSRQRAEGREYGRRQGPTQQGGTLQ